MKILILGGTGAMGQYLVPMLVQNGNKVYVTSRKAKISNQNLIYLQGNAHENLFLDKILKNKYDVIIDFMVYNTEEFSKRIDKFLSSTSQYIFLSSSRVYANSEKTLTEESPRLLDVCKDINYLKTDEYALAKAKQENLLLNSSNKNWTIIRPYITYSENRLQLGVLEKEIWLYYALLKKEIVFSKDIADKTTTLTCGLNVAQGIASIIGKDKALTQIFHITSNKSICWNSVLNIYCQVLTEKLGENVKPVLIEKALNLKTEGQYQIKYDRYYNRVFNNSKISEFININNFIQPEDGLKKNLTKFLIQPSFNYIPYGKIGEYDRLLSNWTSIGNFEGVMNKCRYLVHRLNLR